MTLGSSFLLFTFSLVFAQDPPITSTPTPTPTVRTVFVVHSLELSPQYPKCVTTENPNVRVTVWLLSNRAAARLARIIFAAVDIQARLPPCTVLPTGNEQATEQGTVAEYAGTVRPEDDKNLWYGVADITIAYGFPATVTQYRPLNLVNFVRGENRPFFCVGTETPTPTQTIRSGLYIDRLVVTAVGGPCVFLDESRDGRVTVDVKITAIRWRMATSLRLVFRAEAPGARNLPPIRLDPLTGEASGEQLLDSRLWKRDIGDYKLSNVLFAFDEPGLSTLAINQEEYVGKIRLCFQDFTGTPTPTVPASFAVQAVVFQHGSDRDCLEVSEYSQEIQAEVRFSVSFQLGPVNLYMSLVSTQTNTQVQGSSQTFEIDPDIQIHNVTVLLTVPSVTSFADFTLDRVWLQQQQGNSRTAEATELPPTEDTTLCVSTSTVTPTATHRGTIILQDITISPQPPICVGMGSSSGSQLGDRGTLTITVQIERSWNIRPTSLYLEWSAPVGVIPLVLELDQNGVGVVQYTPPLKGDYSLRRLECRAPAPFFFLPVDNAESILQRNIEFCVATVTPTPTDSPTPTNTITTTPTQTAERRHKRVLITLSTGGGTNNPSELLVNGQPVETVAIQKGGLTVFEFSGNLLDGDTFYIQTRYGELYTQSPIFPQNGVTVTEGKAVMYFDVPHDLEGTLYLQSQQDINRKLDLEVIDKSFDVAYDNNKEQWIIDGRDHPDLVLFRGLTYEFSNRGGIPNRDDDDNDDNSNAPGFTLESSPGVEEHSDAVINNGAPAHQSVIIRVDDAFDGATALYYNDDNNNNNDGLIKLVDSGAVVHSIREDSSSTPPQIHVDGKVVFYGQQDRNAGGANVDKSYTSDFPSGATGIPPLVLERGKSWAFDLPRATGDAEIQWTATLFNTANPNTGTIIKDSDQSFGHIDLVVPQRDELESDQLALTIQSEGSWIPPQAVVLDVVDKQYVISGVTDEQQWVVDNHVADAPLVMMRDNIYSITMLPINDHVLPDLFIQDPNTGRNIDTVRNNGRNWGPIVIQPDDATPSNLIYTTDQPGQSELTGSIYIVDSVSVESIQFLLQRVGTIESGECVGLDHVNDVLSLEVQLLIYVNKDSVLPSNIHVELINHQSDQQLTGSGRIIYSSQPPVGRNSVSVSVPLQVLTVPYNGQYMLTSVKLDSNQLPVSSMYDTLYPPTNGWEWERGHINICFGPLTNTSTPTSTPTRSHTGLNTLTSTRTTTSTHTFRQKSKSATPTASPIFTPTPTDSQSPTTTPNITETFTSTANKWEYSSCKPYYVTPTMGTTGLLFVGSEDLTDVCLVVWNSILNTTAPNQPVSPETDPIILCKTTSEPLTVTVYGLFLEKQHVQVCGGLTLVVTDIMATVESVVSLEPRSALTLQAATHTDATDTLFRSNGDGVLRMSGNAYLSNVSTNGNIIADKFSVIHVLDNWNISGTEIILDGTIRLLVEMDQNASSTAVVGSDTPEDIGNSGVTANDNRMTGGVLYYGGSNIKLGSSLIIEPTFIWTLPDDLLQRLHGRGDWESNIMPNDTTQNNNQDSSPQQQGLYGIHFTHGTARLNMDKQQGTTQNTRIMVPHYIYKDANLVGQGQAQLATTTLMIYNGNVTVNSTVDGGPFVNGDMTVQPAAELVVHQTATTTTTTAPSDDTATSNQNQGSGSVNNGNQDNVWQDNLVVNGTLFWRTKKPIVVYLYDVPNDIDVGDTIQWISYDNVVLPKTDESTEYNKDTNPYITESPVTLHCPQCTYTIIPEQLPVFADKAGHVVVRAIDVGAHLSDVVTLEFEFPGPIVDNWDPDRFVEEIADELGIHEKQVWLGIAKPTGDNRMKVLARFKGASKGQADASTQKLIALWEENGVGWKYIINIEPGNTIPYNSPFIWELVLGIISGIVFILLFFAMMTFVVPKYSTVLGLKATDNYSKLGGAQSTDNMMCSTPTDPTSPTSAAAAGATDNPLRAEDEEQPALEEPPPPAMISTNAAAQSSPSSPRSPTSANTNLTTSSTLGAAGINFVDRPSSPTGSVYSRASTTNSVRIVALVEQEDQYGAQNDLTANKHNTTNGYTGGSEHSTRGSTGAYNGIATNGVISTNGVQHHHQTNGANHMKNTNHFEGQQGATSASQGTTTTNTGNGINMYNYNASTSQQRRTRTATFTQP